MLYAKHLCEALLIIGTCSDCFPIAIKGVQRSDRTQKALFVRRQILKFNSDI